MSAVAVTTCPATPSVMPKSRAIRGSRLAGRNSLVTRGKMATIRAMTPGQPDRTGVRAGLSTTVTEAGLVMGPAPQEDMPQGRERTGSGRRDGARRTLAGQAKKLTMIVSPARGQDSSGNGLGRELLPQGAQRRPEAAYRPHWSSLERGQERHAAEGW